MSQIDLLTIRFDFLKPTKELGCELDKFYRYFPVQMYVRNAKGLYLWGNEEVSHILSLAERSELFKKDIFDFCEEQCALAVNTNDLLVLEQSQALNCKEIAEFSNGIKMQVISIKEPILNPDREVVGLFGISAAIPLSSYQDRIEKLLLAGLTQREAEIALEYVKKISSKEIALKLNISSRTVEKHIENIRIKLGLIRPSQLYDCMESIFNLTFRTTD